MNILRKKALLSMGGGLLLLVPLGIVLLSLGGAPCSLVGWYILDPLLGSSLSWWEALFTTGLILFCFGALIGWIGYGAFVSNKKVPDSLVTLFLVIVGVVGAVVFVFPICY
jgi:hypothetical protein